MSDAQLDRWGGITGVAICLLVAAPVLINQLAGADPTRGPAWLWWVVYAGYLVAVMTVDEEWPHRRPAWLRHSWVLGALVVLGCLAVMLAPHEGLTAVLLVVTSAVASYTARARTVVAIVVVQSVVLGLAIQLGGGGVTETVLSVMIYAVLQAGVALMVISWMREASARAELAATNAELAATNAELQAAHALLAESSRATERLRIARDLHDLVGHQLTALSLELEVASHQATPPASEHVTRSRRIAKDLLDDVRAAVQQLRTHPPALRAALEAIRDHVAHPAVHLCVDDAVEVDQERLDALVRCTQELITNAIRHADADNLWIEVTATAEGAIALHSHDDGGGVAHLEVGNGLASIRERVEGLGGRVAIDHRDGFRVRAEVPAP